MFCTLLDLEEGDCKEDKVLRKINSIGKAVFDSEVFVGEELVGLEALIQLFPNYTGIWQN